MARRGSTNLLLYLWAPLVYGSQTSAFKITFGCGEDMTKCRTGECIPVLKLCDGEFDCPDGWDENEDDCTNLKNLYIVVAVIGGLIFLATCSFMVKMLRQVPWDEVRAVLVRVLEDYNSTPPPWLHPQSSTKRQPEAAATQARPHCSTSKVEDTRPTEEQPFLEISKLSARHDQDRDTHEAVQLNCFKQEIAMTDRWQHGEEVTMTDRWQHGEAATMSDRWQQGPRAVPSAPDRVMVTDDESTLVRECSGITLESRDADIHHDGGDDSEHASHVRTDYMEDELGVDPQTSPHCELPPPPSYESATSSVYPSHTPTTPAY